MHEITCRACCRHRRGNVCTQETITISPKGGCLTLEAPPRLHQGACFIAGCEEAAVDFCRLCDAAICANPEHLFIHPTSGLPWCIRCALRYNLGHE